MSPLHIIFFYFLDSSPLCKTKRIDIKYWSAPDHTRIVLYTEKTVNWNIVKSEDPRVFIVDIEITDNLFSRDDIKVDNAIIHNIKILKLEQDKKIRLYIYLVKPAILDVYTLKRFLKNPPRLVFVVSRPDLSEKERIKRLSLKMLHAEGFKIVVIDPGHGGEDPGAIGLHGKKEKDIALSIGKQLQRVLNNKKGFKAALTRTQDYFLPLRERIKISSEYGADLFISLHADWNNDTNVRGTSMYCLSMKGASDEGAKLLAEKENLSDFIGRAPIEYENNELQSILLNLLQTKTINTSLRFAGLALRELNAVNKLKYDIPKQAAFAVLKSPVIPSVLAEIAYISNPKEERLLASKDFHQRVARALSKAAIRFLSDDSFTEEIVLKENSFQKVHKSHKVKKGESLWKIAKKYGVSIRALKRINGLDNANHIMPGRRLVLP